jgi:hypothetical protein
LFRYGSEADVTRSRRDVRFTPERGRSSAPSDNVDRCGCRP